MRKLTSLFISFVILAQPVFAESEKNDGVTVVKNDYNHDGKVDAVLYMKNGKIVRKEMDLNGDGKIDDWHYYNDDGIEIKHEVDMHRDGKSRETLSQAENVVTYDNGGIKENIKYLDDLYRNDKTKFKLVVNEANLYLTLNQPERAKTLLDGVSDKNKNNDEWFMIMSLVEYTYGNLSSLADLLNKAIAINPKRSDAHGMLGYVYHITGHFDKACEEYKKALAINPSEAFVEYNLQLASKGGFCVQECTHGNGAKDGNYTLEQSCTEDCSYPMNPFQINGLF